MRNNKTALIIDGKCSNCGDLDLCTQFCGGCGKQLEEE